MIYCLLLWLRWIIAAWWCGRWNWIIRWEVWRVCWIRIWLESSLISSRCGRWRRTNGSGGSNVMHCWYNMIHCIHRRRWNRNVRRWKRRRIVCIIRCCEIRWICGKMRRWSIYWFYRIHDVRGWTSVCRNHWRFYLRRFSRCHYSTVVNYLLIFKYGHITNLINTFTTYHLVY